MHLNLSHVIWRKKKRNQDDLILLIKRFPFEIQNQPCNNNRTCRLKFTLNMQRYTAKTIPRTWAYVLQKHFILILLVAGHLDVLPPSPHPTPTHMIYQDAKHAAVLSLHSAGRDERYDSKCRASDQVWPRSDSPPIERQ